jgi:ubiquinone/menaquinone biosynthesis C-methylase UbiE
MGECLKKNPTWHVEFSAAKAKNIVALMARNGLAPKTICEVGCGAAEVLRQLQLEMPTDCTYWGYDISPDAIALAKTRENERLQVGVADFGVLETPRFDVLLMLEVIDHVEDVFGFLRMLKPRAEWKIFSFSLDISVQAVLRRDGLLNKRDRHSHRHHFNKETVLRVLEEVEYEIVDYGYPPIDVTPRILSKLARPIRSMFFTLNPDQTVRVLGGHSLLILTR